MEFDLLNREDREELSRVLQRGQTLIWILNFMTAVIAFISGYSAKKASREIRVAIMKVAIVHDWLTGMRGAAFHPQ
jgi:hypothetical protein